MTQIELLKVRLLINDNTKDSLLNQLLEDAKAEILDYTNRRELKPIMEPLQRELTCIYYNRLSSEGEVSRSEGGISVTYETDIPARIKHRLDKYRLLKAVVIANAN